MGARGTWPIRFRGSNPRLVAPDMLHITLSFLGTTPVEDVAVVARLALGCARPVPELAVGGPIWLPPRRPRVVAVSILDGEGQLAALQEDVSAALSAGLGLEPERRRFRPHLSLARMPAGTASGEGRALAPTPPIAFAAEYLTVYRSRLSAAGAQYEALERVALA